MDTKTASLYYWNGYDMFFGMFPNNTEHQHHVIQIEIGIEAAFRLQIEGGAYDYRAVIIAPNVPHQVDDHRKRQLMLHVEPDSPVGRKLLKTYLQNRRFKQIGFKSIEPLLPEIDSFVSRIHPCQRAKKLFNDIIYALLKSPVEQCPVDDRIRTALGILRHMPVKKISTKAVAAAVCLSESRFIHLFKYQVGIPVRRYLLWLRLRDAVEQILNGMAFTNAAHHAGFSDSAHLSRTFKQMSGMTLTDYLKNSQFIQAISCLD
jgi:AraC-like DNA-binding protein